MDAIDRLAAHFQKLPGVGQRQARRMVYTLLHNDQNTLNEFGDAITKIKTHITQCDTCFRFSSAQTKGTTCTLCTHPERDEEKLMVIESDNDLLAIERSGTYNGFYFVLGGTIPLLDEKNTHRVRGNALLKRITDEHSSTPKEVILAFSLNPDGENTARYVEGLIEKHISPTPTISHLGRGLSTGSELEYADPETIKNALSGRTQH